MAPDYMANQSGYPLNTGKPEWPPRVPNYVYFGGYAPRQSFLNYFLAWESSEYKKDQRAARRIGAVQLASLLLRFREVNKTAEINLVAHNMGCYVLHKALTLNPNLAAMIHKIVWLAPDVDYGVFDDEAFDRAIAQVASLDVFYSRNDGALKWPSRMQNGDHRLGARGPKRGVPPNVIMHDLTAQNLVNGANPPAGQSNDQVETLFGDVATHTAFLLRSSGVPDMVANILTAR